MTIRMALATGAVAASSSSPNKPRVHQRLHGGQVRGAALLMAAGVWAGSALQKL